MDRGVRSHLQKEETERQNQEQEKEQRSFDGKGITKKNEEKKILKN